MANRVAPQGLLPVSHLFGGAWNGQMNVYYIPSTDNNAYAIGDPVVLAGSADASGVPSITLASAGSTNLVLGPIMSVGGKVYGGDLGVNPVGNQDAIVIPATKTQAYYVGVVDDPYVIFSVSEDSTGTAFTAAEVALNCSLKSGTNNGFVSGWVLDNSTEATTAALQMKLLRLEQASDNAFGLSARWLCLINQHCFKATVAGL